MEIAALMIIEITHNPESHAALELYWGFGIVSKILLLLIFLSSKLERYFYYMAI